MPTVYPKDYFLPSSRNVNRASCFILMPFASKFNEVYDTIKEALESENLKISCKRADDFHQAHIIETILKGIALSEYIIADLTESNSNVFYELGLVHCIKDINKVIIITQDMKYIPFDLRQFRSIIYEQSISGSKKLKEELIKTFKEAEENTFRIQAREKERVPFSQSLVGEDKFLYELEFEFPYVGHGGTKMQIHFTQLSADKSKKRLQEQFLFLGDTEPTKKIKHIPWTVSIIRTVEKEVVISLDKV